MLRSGYAALVTRDGLICLDPATRLTRWERADVSPRVQVWGDEHHLFLVETDGQGAHTSRVLRAADGAAVPSAPDFAAKFMDAGRRAVLHRQLLARRRWLLLGDRVYAELRKVGYDARQRKPMVTSVRPPSTAQ